MDELQKAGVSVIVGTVTNIVGNTIWVQPAGAQAVSVETEGGVAVLPGHRVRALRNKQGELVALRNYETDEVTHLGLTSSNLIPTNNRIFMTAVGGFPILGLLLIIFPVIWMRQYISNLVFGRDDVNKKFLAAIVVTAVSLAFFLIFMPAVAIWYMTGQINKATQANLDAIDAALEGPAPEAAPIASVA